MKIKRLVIENFKSIERIELVEPNPFTVFVGPNGSGKSNIFEALEFSNLSIKAEKRTVESLFSGKEKFLNRHNRLGAVEVYIELEGSSIYRLVQRPNLDEQQEYRLVGTRGGDEDPIKVRQNNQQFLVNFLRLFINNHAKQKLNYSDDLQLTFSAGNLEKVLKRILNNNTIRSEIFEWLGLFVPDFKAVEIDDRDELHWFENASPEYFTKDLISDGTYNILALLTAVYQSDEPQFLCIEEPENGLHPEVIMSLVDFFRNQCEEKGHYIWLNTHSTSLVSKLQTKEIVLVEKKEGATTTKQVGNRNLYDLEVDYAWLSGALGGGLPW